MPSDFPSSGSLFAAFLTWATGDAGRQWVAGGAGGLLRWALSERVGSLGKWLLSGLLQSIGGAVTAYYGGGLVLWAIERVTGDLGPPGPDPQSLSMAGFVTGMIGLSAARILIAVFDKRAPALIDKTMGGDGA